MPQSVVRNSSLHYMVTRTSVSLCFSSPIASLYNQVFSIAAFPFSLSNFFDGLHITYLKDLGHIHSLFYYLVSVGGRALTFIVTSSEELPQ